MCALLSGNREEKCVSVEKEETWGKMRIELEIRRFICLLIYISLCPFTLCRAFFSLFLCSVLLLNLILSFSDSGKEKIP